MSFFFAPKWMLAHCHDSRLDCFGADLRLSWKSVNKSRVLSKSIPLHYITFFLMCDVISREHPWLFRAHKKQLKRKKERQNAANHLVSAGCLSIILQGETLQTNQLLALDKDCKHCNTSRCWMRCWPSASWEMNTKKNPQEGHFVEHVCCRWQTEELGIWILVKASQLWLNKPSPSGLSRCSHFSTA